MKGGIIDNPGQVAAELRDFRRTAMLLSSEGPRMVDLYPHQWVALYAGEVKAHADNYEAVLDEIDRQNIPRGRAIIRYIDPNPRTLIL